MPGDSPQLEDGFTRIASELLDALIRHPFTKREYKVVLAVIRKTYGFGKKSDDMTMTQIEKMTGLKLPHVSATVRDLALKNVLLIRSGEHGKVIALSKNYPKWKKTLSRSNVTKTVSDQTGHVTETVTSGDQNSQSELPKQSSEVTKTVTTIDNPNKKPQKKTPIDSSDEAASQRSPAPAEPITNGIWTAYRTAYRDRYQIDPVRNQTVNGQLANFVKRIGREEAPAVAAYYVSLNDAWYVKAGHSVAAMLKDAEKLRTLWATNRRSSQAAAHEGDRLEKDASEWNEIARRHGSGQ